ncbi:MAG: nickel pincer cofactor biosynthesis protein LarC [Pyramidobacter sp.]|jgi:uncharacterized protein (TIGR00299 family) protein
MRTLYLDCSSGIAGDMFLGALLDLGLDTAVFKDRMAALGLSEFEIQVNRAPKFGFMGTDVKVADLSAHEHHHDHGDDHDEGDHHHEHHHDHHHNHVHRGFNEIKEIIGRSGLSEEVKTRSIEAFKLLGEAEASVHGVTLDEIHFHEMGAVDSIVDIVGAFVLLEMLKVDRVCASSVNVGSGTVKCAHGIMPVPAPATARLLENVPVFSLGEPMERTTPTGAVLLKTLCRSFGPLPAGVIKATGFGFGDHESDLPNMLRAMVIEESENRKLPYSAGKTVVMETNVDDMNPQDYQELSTRLFEAGALDVFFTPIFMKKMRPAVRITCIATPEKREALGEIILRYSATIGLRWDEVNRMTLRRKIVSFESSYGKVAMKLAFWDDEVLHVTPEFEDLRALSRKLNIPVSDLRTAILCEYRSGQRS